MDTFSTIKEVLAKIESISQTDGQEVEMLQDLLIEYHNKQPKQIQIIRENDKVTFNVL